MKPTAAATFLAFSAMLTPVDMVPLSPAVRAADAGQHQSESIEQRLAIELGRAARQSVQVDPMTTKALDAGCALIEQAVALDPSNPELWRIAMKLGSLNDRADLSERASAALQALDPDDQVAQLHGITLQIEQQQTVEGRLAAYETLLSPASRAQLGPVITSRLLLDKALLLRRHGHTTAFADTLAESVAVDPANQTAVSVASGYFSANVDDPAAEAELLITLVMSNPTSADNVGTLAALLLNHGAYPGAARMYELTSAIKTANSQPIDADLLADHIIAAWAAGQREKAERLLRDRQAIVNQLMRRQIAAQRARGQVIDELDGDALLGPLLATVRAAFLERTGSAEAAGSLQSVRRSYREIIRSIEASAEPDRQRIAELHLEIAFTLLWLGADAESAAEHLSHAEAVTELSDAARARFDGWLAMRRGDLDQADSLLASLVATDPLAQLGMALTNLKRGDRRAAATNLLAITREQPGTLIGVWCNELLVELLGQRVPISRIARRMDELVDTLPRFIDRLPAQPTLALAVRLDPRTTSLSAMDPWIVLVEITNNAPIPLAIDTAGPIRPQMLIGGSVRVPGSMVPTPRPVVVDLDRRLRLEPRQRLVIPVDLRLHALAGNLQQHLLSGSIVRLEGMWNAIPGPGGQAMRPGMLGAQARSQAIRVDGARISIDWLQSSLAAIEEPALRSDIEALVLLSHVDEAALQVAGITGERASEFLGMIERAVPAAFAQLDPINEAWVLALLGEGPARTQVRTIAQRSEQRWARVMYLLHHVERSTDSMIDAALRGDDELIIVVAEHVRGVLQRAEQQRLEGGGQPRR